MQRLIGEDIDFQTALGEGLGMVKADRGQVEQVIMNLAINARDAMPSGGKLIIETSNVDVDESYIKQHPTVTPGAYVMLSVSDTGTGIDKSTLDRILEPFFTTKKRGKSTGLGLATVYGIVKQSGGYIWVYSEPGTGTTFKIYLPRTAEKAGVAAVMDTKPRVVRGTETVLLVEDQALLRRVIQSMLEQDGYKLLSVENPAKGLEKAQDYAGAIELLITDVILPGMNGRAFAEQLMKTRPGTKVLFVSGYTENVVTLTGQLHTTISFLQKPFTSETLGKKVREILDQH